MKMTTLGLVGDQFFLTLWHLYR